MRNIAIKHYDGFLQWHYNAKSKVKEKASTKQEKTANTKNKCNREDQRVHKRQGMEEIENLKYCGKAKAKN